MGKSLSILAITIQIYNINGWSIYPQHLALGNDVELPPAMEHLRPYLRKRKGPIRAPPGLQHNQRYYPQSMQSRQLLMDGKTSESNSKQDSMRTGTETEATTTTNPPQSAERDETISSSTAGQSATSTTSSARSEFRKKKLRDWSDIETVDSLEDGCGAGCACLIQ